MDISYCDDKTGFPRPGHIYMYKLYHTTSGISLLLHDAEVKQSVNKNDIPQV